MKVENLLRVEIETELEELKNRTFNSEERDSRVNRVAKLLDRLIELEKINVESEEKYECRKFDTEYRTKQAKDDKKDKSVKNWLACATIILQISELGFYFWGANAMFAFEKEGTISSLQGRNLLTRMLPRSRR